MQQCTHDDDVKGVLVLLHVLCGVHVEQRASWVIEGCGHGIREELLGDIAHPPVDLAHDHLQAHTQNRGKRGRGQ